MIGRNIIVLHVLQPSFRSLNLASVSIQREDRREEFIV